VVNMTDYDKICNFENLYRAHLKARLGKKHKLEVTSFETHLSMNLLSMAALLRARTYQMQGYYHFTISEPKRREIFAAHYPDRVLLHCVCDNVLAPILQPRLIYDNVACQPGKGTHFALNRMTEFLRRHYIKHGAEGYILKCDIRKYFASIDQETLKKQLARVVRDEDVCQLLFHYIDSYNTDGRPGRGIPLGNQSSQWFAVFYLNPVDRLVKEKLRIKHYLRYMDDMVLVHHSKEYLQECLRQIRALCDALGLELNEKTQIFPLRAGVDFLGWHFYLTESGKIVRKLRRGTKTRYKRRLRRLESDYGNHLVDEADVKMILASYHGHFKHGHAYRLQAHTLRDFTLVRR